MVEMVFAVLIIAFIFTLFIKNNRVASIISLVASLFPLAAFLDWGKEFGINLISIGFESSMNMDMAGITLHFSISPLAWFFGIMLFSLIPPILLYSYSFFSKNDGFYPFMILLMLSVMGILLSSDFLSFFLFWELMALGIFIMICRNGDRKAMVRYLSYSVLSGVLILAGIALLYHMNGTLLFAEIMLKADFETMVAITMLIIGFAIKAALMPLHTWVPPVYSTSDEPFVAFLSGGLSKIGYYGMLLLLFAMPGARVMEAYINSSIATYLLAIIGSLTAFFATFLAIFEDDLRKLLAYSSIAQLGYIAVGIGIGSSIAMAGALFQAFNHAFFKATLFLAAGSVAYRTGKWKISELGGVAYKMPLTFMAALFAIFALAAIPITSGFAAKWLLYEAAIERRYVFIAPIMLIAGVGAFLYSFRILYGVFLGENRYPDIKEAPKPMVAGMFLLVMPLIIFLIFPGYMLNMMDSFLSSAGLATISHSPYVIHTTLGNYNTIAVIVGMMFAMIPAFLIYVLRKQRLVDFEDNFIGGEIPSLYEHISMHAAHNFYKPLKDVVMPYLEGGATSIYSSLYKVVEKIADGARKIYDGVVQDYAIYVMLFLLIIAGWLLW